MDKRYIIMRKCTITSEPRYLAGSDCNDWSFARADAATWPPHVILMCAASPRVNERILSAMGRPASLILRA